GALSRSAGGFGSRPECTTDCCGGPPDRQGRGHAGPSRVVAGPVRFPHVACGWATPRGCTTTTTRCPDGALAALALSLAEPRVRARRWTGPPWHGASYRRCLRVTDVTEAPGPLRAEGGFPVVGIIGGGQLARMSQQPAIALSITLSVLAESPTASAALVVPHSP